MAKASRKELFATLRPKLMSHNGLSTEVPGVSSEVKKKGAMITNNSIS
jgi:hypothetical protein